jgi:hypothetical protein
MPKRQLIEAIREFNPTAQPQFLAQFEEAELQEYLDHLRSAMERKIQIKSWVRKVGELRKVS